MYTTDKLLLTVGEYTANPSDSIFKDLFLLLRTRHFYYRWKCEQLYRVQSQTTGAYDSHFWTKALPKLDRYRRRGAGDPRWRASTPNLRQGGYSRRSVPTRGTHSCLSSHMGLLRSWPSSWLTGTIGRPCNEDEAEYGMLRGEHNQGPEFAIF